jgi:hypothetical protein
MQKNKFMEGQLAKGGNRRYAPEHVIKTFNVKFGAAVDFKKTTDVVEFAPKEEWVSLTVQRHWTAAFRIATQEDGQLVIGEVRVFPKENGFQAGCWSAEFLGSSAKAPVGGINARLLRDVKVGDAWQFIRRISHFFRASEEDGSRLKTESTQKARRGKSDVFLAELAEEYVRAGDNPIATIAIRRGIDDKSEVRDMVRAARVRGLLSAGHQGRPSGELTPTALALLQSRPRKKGDKHHGRVSKTKRG